jgi:hypothetical protein
VHERRIPEMFQNMLTALIVTTPEDHLDFLVDYLNRVKVIQTNTPNGEDVRVVHRPSCIGSPVPNPYLLVRAAATTLRAPDH